MSEQVSYETFVSTCMVSECPFLTYSTIYHKAVILNNLLVATNIFFLCLRRHCGAGTTVSGLRDFKLNSARNKFHFESSFRRYPEQKFASYRLSATQILTDAIGSRTCLVGSVYPWQTRTESDFSVTSVPKKKYWIFPIKLSPNLLAKSVFFERNKFLMGSTPFSHVWHFYL